MIDQPFEAALRRQSAEFATDFTQTNQPLQDLVDQASDPTILSVATKALESSDWSRRVLGARILAGASRATGEAGHALLVALRREANADAVLWELFALSQLNNRPALATTILELADHVDAEVRYKVATAISSCGWPSLPSGAVATMITLSRDPDADVRFGAVFELASWWSDGLRDSRVRDALEERRRDSDDRVQAAIWEALGASAG